VKSLKEEKTTDDTPKAKGTLVYLLCVGCLLDLVVCFFLCCFVVCFIPFCSQIVVVLGKKEPAKEIKLVKKEVKKEVIPEKKKVKKEESSCKYSFIYTHLDELYVFSFNITFPASKTKVKKEVKKKKKRKRDEDSDDESDEGISSRKCI
jgi:hypothetical protein